MKCRASSNDPSAIAAGSTFAFMYAVLSVIGARTMPFWFIP